MFSRLVENWRAKKAVKDWACTTVGVAIKQHTDKFFHEGTILKGLSPENKEKLIDEFVQRIGPIAQHENPFMEFRLQLSTAAITYAQLQVLALEPRDKTEMFFSRYISCELQPYARDCEQHNEDIGQYLWRNPNATDEELVGYLNLQSALYLYHLNGLQIMRGNFERFDFKDNKDWFRPFVRSMLIWHEHLIRQKIGLPNLMPDLILPIQHSTFFNIVRDGHEHPLYEFERHYGVRHDAIC